MARSWRWPLCAGVALTVLVGGVTFEAVASSSAPAVRACTSSKGLLGVPSSKGRCARHYEGVTLDQAGPRGGAGATGKTGPAGPGAFNIAFDQTSGQSNQTVAVAGDAVAVHCGTGASGSSYVEVTGDSSSNGLYLHGTLDAYSSGDVGLSSTTAGSVTYSKGPSLVANQATPAKVVLLHAAASSKTDVAYGSAHLLVDDGPLLYTVDASLFSTYGRCQALVQIVPGS